MAESFSPSFRRDLATAYLLAGARIASWVFVLGLVYRRLSRDDFALLAFIRSTLALLNYTTLGLAPAMIHFLARSSAGRPEPAFDSLVLQGDSSSRFNEIYSNGLAATAITAAVGCFAVIVYAFNFHRLHHLDGSANITAFVLCMGLGIILRLAGDAPGAASQIYGRIALDNLLQAAGELFWAMAAAVVILSMASNHPLESVAMGFAMSGAIAFIARIVLASRLTGLHAVHPSSARLGIMATLFGFGSLVTLSQLADFLYAPTDYILIDHFLNTAAVARYAPAVQVDAGLLLLVSGLAAVLLPRSAAAHAVADHRRLLRYYVRGTVASGGILLTAALLVWVGAPRIFRIWVGDPLPGTCAILPLVLIHTVIGGSSAVGRAVLLASGRVKPFTASVLIAGVANVLLSFVFVRFFHLGLRGIIYGTIVAVVGRCAVWQPWYVLRALRRTPAAAVY